MIVFPNCKINLGLRILRKRQDGYHDLETVFYPLPFYDALELLPAKNNDAGFTLSGLAVEGNPSDNICLKAYELLKKDFPDLPAIRIHLHKSIPTRAGLGGGSSDAAFTLRLVNEKFRLGLSQQSLIDYALQLGSDCPFFIINKPCLAGSRGEDMQPVQLDLSAYRIVLINPGIAVSTKEAFSSIKPAVPNKSTLNIISQPIETWKNELINDFENSVFQQYPELDSIKQELYNSGAIYASMSGSGSSIYGIFSSENSISLASNLNFKVFHAANAERQRFN